MKERPYQHLPPLEHRPDSFPYRMTPAQRKRASSLIRRECCNCGGGNCFALDDGDTCTCPQMITFSVCCKWFRWAVLPLDRTLEAEIYRDCALKRCGQLRAGKALICKAPQAQNRGGRYVLSPTPENGLLTVHKTRYDKHDLHSPAGESHQLHPAPQFPF